MATQTDKQQLLEWYVAQAQPVCVVTHYHAEQLTQATPSCITITGHFNSMAEVERCLADPCTAARSELISK